MWAVALRWIVRSLLTLAALLALVALAAVAYVVWVVLASHNGVARAGGTETGMPVQAPVTIARDARGVPHIRAASLHDLFVAEGWVMASDRLFQMDLTRRYVDGRLSEVLGSNLVRVDRRMRRYGIRDLAARVYASAGPDEKAMLVAFADGINAAAARQPTPPEYRALFFRFERWQPEDALAVGFATVLDLDDKPDDVIVRDDVHDVLGQTGIDALYPLTDPKYDVPTNGSRPGAIAKLPALTGVRQGDYGAIGEPADERPPIGSNGWAVGAERTTVGRAILANDPHLDIGVPGIWYLVEAAAPGLHVAGGALAGTPGVTLGHNEHVAWGVTAGETAAMHVVREQTRGTDELYEHGRWVHARHRHEIITIRFGGTKDDDLLESDRGVVMYRDAGLAYLMDWRMRRHPVSPLAPFTSLLRARTAAEGIAAMRALPEPALNVLVADDAGRVAYHLAGGVPLEPSWGRWAPNGDLPEPQYSSYDSAPHVDPSRNALLVTANNRAGGDGTPRLAPYWQPPYRAFEIRRALAASADAHGRLSPDAIAHEQRDATSPAEREFADLVLASATRAHAERDAALAPLVGALRTFDGTLVPESRGATAVVALRREMLGALAARAPAVMARALVPADGARVRGRAARAARTAARLGSARRLRCVRHDVTARRREAIRRGRAGVRHVRRAAAEAPARAVRLQRVERSDDARPRRQLRACSAVARPRAVVPRGLDRRRLGSRHDRRRRRRVRRTGLTALHRPERRLAALRAHAAAVLRRRGESRDGVDANAHALMRSKLRRCARRLVAALASFAVLLAPAAGSTPDAAYRAKPRVSHVKLANGLDVVVIENHAAPLAEVAVWYGRGSVDDPPHRSGLAHALEHMLYRGNRALSGAAEDDLDARLGIDANASTHYTATEFHDLVPAQRIELAMRIEAARMSGALLRERDWNVERGVVIAEVRSRLSSRSAALRSAVRRALFAGTPYEHDPAGTVEDVSRITITDLRRAYARAYGARDATLVVTGDVVPPRVFALARRIFGPLPAGKEMDAAPNEAPVRRGITVRTSAPGPDTLVDIVLESPSISGSAEAIASELLRPTHDPLSFWLNVIGPCSSYDFVDDTQANAGLYHVVCHLERGGTPREAVETFSDAVRQLADHPHGRAYDVARRAVGFDERALLDDLDDEADYYGATFADGENPNAFRFAATDAQVSAMLRRWVTPIAIGISSPAGTMRIAAATVPRASASGDRPRGRTANTEPFPAWARAELARPLAEREAREQPSWFALPNGVRLVVQRRAGSGLAYVRAGFDEPGLFGRVGDGVRRVAGSVFVGGSRRWPAQRMLLVGDRHGITIDLDTQSSASGPSGELPLMFDILADAWRAPQISPASVRGARAAAIGEAKTLARDPDRLAIRMLGQSIADPTASRLDPVGDQRRADISERAVRAFFRAHVRPERAWIAVVGDVDPEAVYRQATRAFGGWRVRPAEPQLGAAPSTTPPSGRARVRTMRVARSTTRIMLGATAPQFGDSDRDGMTLLTTVAGGSMSTRLMRELRFRRGLAYSVSSSYDDELGRVYVTLQCAPRDRAVASALLRRTLADIAAHPPSSDELERARGELLGEALSAQASAGGMLDALVDAARGTGSPDLAALDARLRAAGGADIARIARTYFDPDRFAEVDEGP